jgi:hypothetical protein
MARLEGEKTGVSEILHCVTAVPQERDGEKAGRHSVRRYRQNDAAGVLAAGADAKRQRAQEFTATGAKCEWSAAG